MRCPSCGHESSAHYCGECGERLGKRIIPYPVFVIISVCIAGILIGAFLTQIGLFQQQTTLTISAKTNAKDCAGTYAYTASLAAKQPLANQPLTITIDGNAETLRTDQNGLLSSTKELTPSWCGVQHTIAVTYAGTTNYAPAQNATTITVKIPARITLFTPKQVSQYTDGNITATLTDAMDNTALANRLVRIATPVAEQYIFTDHTGTVTLPATFTSAGTVQLTATFLGDDVYERAQTSVVDILITEETPEHLVQRLQRSVVFIAHDAISGSGVIIDQQDSQTLIITNKHVVTNATNLLVMFSNGSTSNATRILLAPHDLDLAAIIIEGTTGIPAIIDQQPQQGTRVYALGSPLGLRGTVSAGILSNIVTGITESDYEFPVLQTDAAINPGSSGGGLFSKNGLLGINTLKRLDAEGIGFAISIAVLEENSLANWTIVQ